MCLDSPQERVLNVQRGQEEEQPQEAFASSEYCTNNDIEKLNFLSPCLSPPLTYFLLFSPNLSSPLLLQAFELCFNILPYLPLPPQSLTLRRT